MYLNKAHEKCRQKYTRLTKKHKKRKRKRKREKDRKRTKKFLEEERAHLLLKGTHDTGTLLMGTHDTDARWQVTGPMLIGRGYGRVAVVIRLLVG